jgi:hypothetical protein
MPFNLSLPAIHAAHIPYHNLFNWILKSNESCGPKQTIQPRHKSNFTSESDQTVLFSISGFRSSCIRGRNMCNIECFLEFYSDLT